MLGCHVLTLKLPRIAFVFEWQMWGDVVEGRQSQYYTAKKANF